MAYVLMSPFSTDVIMHVYDKFKSSVTRVTFENS